MQSRSWTGRQLSDLVGGLLASGTVASFRANGRSMVPAIRDGDLVTAVPMPPGGPSLGDVVAFRRPANGALVVHRVVRLRRGHATVKGDNVPEPDGEFPVGDLLGLVSRVERRGRTTWTVYPRVRPLLAFASTSGLIRAGIALGALVRSVRRRAG